MDLGPSVDVTLQWARYTDAADQAGLSRRRGGIHVPEDDLHGRIIGAATGAASFSLARQYWSGSIASSYPTATASPTAAGLSLTWNSLRGAWYRIESSADLQSWSPVGPAVQAYLPTTTWTDPSPLARQRFYRIVQRFSP